MRASVSMAKDELARLRQRIAEIEGRPVTLPGEESLLPFGVARLDRQLAGGLRRDALHEIRGITAPESVAAFGFAAAILSRLGKTDPRPVLVVADSRTLYETGHPYALGLEAYGLDPRRLVVVRTRRPADTLWVFEEAIRCGGLLAVLAEITGTPHQLDLTASRRLALRAGESGVMGLMLRHAEEAEPGAADTRWHVRPRRAATLQDFPAGFGRPAWRLELERNRHGPTGLFDLEWNHDERSFAAPQRTALPLHRPPLSADGPHPPDAARPILAFPRAAEAAARGGSEGEGGAPSRRAG
jgi:protein ImuA